MPQGPTRSPQCTAVLYTSCNTHWQWGPCRRVVPWVADFARWCCCGIPRFDGTPCLSTLPNVVIIHGIQGVSTVYLETGVYPAPPAQPRPEVSLNSGRVIHSLRLVGPLDVAYPLEIPWGLYVAWRTESVPCTVWYSCCLYVTRSLYLPLLALFFRLFCSFEQKHAVVRTIPIPRSHHQVSQSSVVAVGTVWSRVD